MTLCEYIFHKVLTISCISNPVGFTVDNQNILPIFLLPICGTLSFVKPLLHLAILYSLLALRSASSFNQKIRKPSSPHFHYIKIFRRGSTPWLPCSHISIFYKLFNFLIHNIPSVLPFVSRIYQTRKHQFICSPTHPLSNYLTQLSLKCKPISPSSAAALRRAQ